MDRRMRSDCQSFARCEEDPEDDELEATTERLRVKERDLQIREARDLEDAPGCK